MYDGYYMYDLVKTVAVSLLMPLPILAAVFVCGWWLAARGARRWGRALKIGAVGVLFLLSWAPVAEPFLGALESRYPALVTWPDDPSIEAVVVLGGGWSPGFPASVTSRLNDSSALRLMEGIRLWHQRPETPLVLMSLPSGYEQAARALGVPADRLRPLEWPEDTAQEARAVREALGEGARVILVTSASHMPRSMTYFQAAGLEPIAAPADYQVRGVSPATLHFWIPSPQYLVKSEKAIYETLGLIASRWER